MKKDSSLQSSIDKNLIDNDYLDKLVYLDVLNNCEFRVYANMHIVNEYINKYKNNYKNIIIERHCKYIEKYIKCGCNLIKMVRETGISSANLLSIFLRIESQFDLYEKYLKAKKRKEKLKLIRSRKEVFKKFNPGLSEVKNKKIIDILKITYGKDYSNVLPKKASIVLNKLYTGKTLKEIAEELGMSYRYLSTLLIGMNKPRNNNEKGVIRILQENKLI